MISTCSKYKTTILWRDQRLHYHVIADVVFDKDNYNSDTNQKVYFYFTQNIALYEWLPGFVKDKKLPPYPGKSQAECVLVKGNR